MNYRSFDELNQVIINNLHRIPVSTDLVISFTHGGFIVGNLLALHLHLPLTTISYLKEGKIISSGNRMKNQDHNIKKCKELMIVNDSMTNKIEIDRIKKTIKKIHPDKKVTFTTVFADMETIGKNNIYLEHCPTPHIFEWNIYDHTEMKNFCVDIDGVLCHDPLPWQKGEEEKILNFIENAIPLVRIRKKIGFLVTNRLEKYREQTEKWLKKQGIQYGKLYMQNMPDQKARREAKNYGQFKGTIYKEKIKSNMFIESSFGQAREIANISGKMVYCVDKRMMIYPNQSYKEQEDKTMHIKLMWKRHKKRTRRMIKKIESIAQIHR